MKTALPVKIIVIFIFIWGGKGLRVSGRFTASTETGNANFSFSQPQHVCTKANKQKLIFQQFLTEKFKTWHCFSVRTDVLRNRGRNDTEVQLWLKKLLLIRIRPARYWQKIHTAIISIFFSIILENLPCCPTVVRCIQDLFIVVLLFLITTRCQYNIWRCVCACV